MEPTISREFYYIQMEKYARQALSEGIKNAEDLHVSVESELYRVLNLHYNRNNHIEVSQSWPSYSPKINYHLHFTLCVFPTSWDPGPSSVIILSCRSLTVSAGLSSKLLRSSLKQSRLEKIWILPGKNRFTRSLHAWTTTFQNILNLKRFWNS